MKYLIILLGAIAMYATAYAADLSISMEPNVPAPYSTVTLTLVSYSMDVNTSNIVWTVQGREVRRGIGEKSITVGLGPAGSRVPVTATVSDTAGNVIKSTITIAPHAVSVLWEAVESYTPPFYEGKALPAEGSKVRVTVLPDATTGVASYAWFENDTALESASGYGRGSVVVALDPLVDENRITVRVKTIAGNISEKSISLVPRDVMLMVYPYDDIIGTLFARTFIRRIEVAKDTTLSLEPFYFSTKGLEATARYSWYMDGLPVTPTEKTLLALRPKKGTYGTKDLTITTEQSRRRFQNAETSFQIVFDAR